MNRRISCAILIISMAFSTPLRSEKKDYKKLAIISAVSIAATSALVGYLFFRQWHKKEEPSSYECDFCKQLNRRSSLYKLHCGHQFCRACMDEIGHTIIRPEYEGRTYCSVCGESIEASEIYENISEELQDLINTLYFI